MVALECLAWTARHRACSLILSGKEVGIVKVPIPIHPSRINASIRGTDPDSAIRPVLVNRREANIMRPRGPEIGSASLVESFIRFKGEFRCQGIISGRLPFDMSTVRILG
jgi:hypothetical protein